MKTFSTNAGQTDFLASDVGLQAVLRYAGEATSFWDVGANIGLFATLVREKNPALRVVSIEASTDHYHVLCRNWQLNPDNWICLHLAAGDHDGVIQLTRGHGGLDHIVEDGAQNGMAETRPLMTLDSIARMLGQDSIDVMKIDVEGAELGVLKGSSRLLERGAIKTLILEADGHEKRYGWKEKDVDDFLASKGYHLNVAVSITGKPQGNCKIYQRSASSV
jgi:FkbM family methyltransferase